MSKARRPKPDPRPAAAPSRNGSKAAIAEPTERPGQKPCCSEASVEGSTGRNRSTKIFIKIRYHILVTKIGRKLAGSAVSLPGLGIAVNKDVRNRGSKP